MKITIDTFREPINQLIEDTIVDSLAAGYIVTLYYSEVEYSAGYRCFVSEIIDFTPDMITVRGSGIADSSYKEVFTIYYRELNKIIVEANK